MAIANTSEAHSLNTPSVVALSSLASRRMGGSAAGRRQWPRGARALRECPGSARASSGGGSVGREPDGDAGMGEVDSESERGCAAQAASTRRAATAQNRVDMMTFREYVEKIVQKGNILTFR